MPFYIATVWHLSGAAAAVEGDEATTRQVIRMRAEDPGMFEATIRDWWLSDLDADVSFGPISLSKDQVTP